MAHIMIRCGDEKCAGHSADGAWSATAYDEYMRHKTETGHPFGGFWRGGELAREALKGGKLWLITEGEIPPSATAAATQPPQPPQPPPAPPGMDGGDEDDDGDEDGDEDDTVERDEDGRLRDPYPPDGQPRPVAAPGRPPLPDLSRGYVLARDIPMDQTMMERLHSRLAQEGEVLDDDGNPLPYGLAVSRLLAEAVAFHDAHCPGLYGSVRGLQEWHFVRLQQRYAVLEAQRLALEAAQTQMDERFRDLMDREAAVERREAQQHGGTP